MSDRVYRAAWEPERALALLQEEPHAYDQVVVAALKRIVEPVKEPTSPAWVADIARQPAEPTRAAGTTRPAAAS